MSIVEVDPTKPFLYQATAFVKLAKGAEPPLPDEAIVRQVDRIRGAFEAQTGKVVTKAEVKALNNVFDLQGE